MPSMANITVKKADGTTDVVFTVLTPSAGDTFSAKWRSNTVSTIPGHRPTFEMSSRDNGTKDGRRFKMVGRFPILDSSSGTALISAVQIMDVSVMVPQMADSSQVKEAIYQFCNILANQLIKDSLESGYSPT